jgi:uncharacterized membrane protein
VGLGPLIGPAHFPTFLPAPLTSYIGGQRPMSWFGLFPWAAWAFVGLAIGHVWVRAGRSPRREALTYLGTGAAGLALMGGVLLVRKWNPYIIHYPNDLVQQMGPGTFFYRLGLNLVFALLAYAVARLVVGRFSMMRQLGRTSLFVYWIHVDLCYGLVSRRFHGALDMTQATAGFVLMTGAMLLVSLAKTRYWDTWRRQRRQRPRPAAAHPPAPTMV